MWVFKPCFRPAESESVNRTREFEFLISIPDTAVLMSKSPGDPHYILSWGVCLCIAIGKYSVLKLKIGLGRG